MVGEHHQVNGHEFEQAPGDSEGQGRLVCCSQWGHKELGTTEQLTLQGNYFRVVIVQLLSHVRLFGNP